LIEAGRVGRAHGLDGSFYVTRPDASLIGAVVTVSGVERAVVRRSGTDKKPILRLEGVSTREAADALRGEPLLVERREELLEEGEYWAEDLVGLAVVDGERSVGVVARVRSLPSCEVLEVVTSPGDPNLRGSEGETLLIPLVGDAVRDVDLEAGRIDVDLEFLGAG
jgi:16S rRNA processing protein RimM